MTRYFIPLPDLVIVFLVLAAIGGFVVIVYGAAFIAPYTNRALLKSDEVLTDRVSGWILGLVVALALGIPIVLGLR